MAAASFLVVMARFKCFSRVESDKDEFKENGSDIQLRENSSHFCVRHVHDKMTLRIKS